MSCRRATGDEERLFAAVAIGLDLLAQVRHFHTLPLIQGHPADRIDAEPDQVGFAIIGFVLANADVHAKAGGTICLAIGALILIGLRLAGRSIELHLETSGAACPFSR